MFHSGKWMFFALVTSLLKMQNLSNSRRSKLFDGGSCWRITGQQSISQAIFESQDWYCETRQHLQTKLELVLP